MKNSKVITPLIFIVIGIISSLVITKFTSVTIRGKIISNNNSCLNNKSNPCVLQIIDAQNSKYEVDYSYCSIVGKYLPRGYVQKTTYLAKPGDEVVVTGKLRGFGVKVCPGWMPPLQIKVLK